GKPNPLALNPGRLPQEVPGLLKRRGDDVVFYPADELLRPFHVGAEQAATLPLDTVLIARPTKKSVDFALPDGSVERTPVYALNAKAPQAARAAFVGVIDLVGGEPFVRDLMPPARLVGLPATQPGGAPWREGDVVDVRFDGDTATIDKTIAKAGSPKARTWMVASDARLDATFSPAAMQEAAAIEKSAAAALADKGLVDLTKKPFFAIDNPGSTDIDQAMHLEKRADGGYTVMYALADPAHYIKPGSALFDEAMKRGASYYLPGLSIPMLPSVLSEGIVSLNAHEDHRAMVITINLDKDGNVESPATVSRAKIHSQAQLTYEGVSAELEGQARIGSDEHGKPVPAAVRAQLSLFAEIGDKRIGKAKERGVVEPDRREMKIGFDDGRFFLKDVLSNRASKLNAEFSIMANVGGADQLLSSTIPGLYLPGLFRTHREPDDGTYAALARQTGVFVGQHGLDDSWRWQPKQESLSSYVERLKTLPTSSREAQLSQVLQQQAVRINVSSEYERQPGVHSGLKLDHYGRFSAPMREQVGVVSHAIVFAKDALERAATAGTLSHDEARALWAPLLLGALVAPHEISPARRELASSAQALLSASPTALGALAKTLAKQAQSQAPALSSDEQKQVDLVVERARAAGNSGKMKQGQVDGAARKLLFDDLFAMDLGSNPLGVPLGATPAPRREGVVTSVTPGKVYVQLKDPDVEVRLGVDDLRRFHPQAKFHLEDEGCALVSDAGGTLSRLVLGSEVSLQATHHDGDRLHFAVVD
ncbi:MAG TPA: RNB domain-containing ribonuclease, partial [Myxococcota bacterium]